MNIKTGAVHRIMMNAVCLSTRQTSVWSSVSRNIHVQNIFNLCTYKVAPNFSEVNQKKWLSFSQMNQETNLVPTVF